MDFFIYFFQHYISHFLQFAKELANLANNGASLRRNTHSQKKLFPYLQVMTSALANSSFVLGDFELNETLCVHIDDKIEALVDMHEWRQSHGELADYMIPIILMCGSILALFFGATLFRPTAAFAAAMFSFYAIYGFARTIEGTISCETILGWRPPAP